MPSKGAEARWRRRSPARPPRRGGRPSRSGRSLRPCVRSERRTDMFRPAGPNGRTDGTKAPPLVTLLPISAPSGLPRVTARTRASRDAKKRTEGKDQNMQANPPHKPHLIVAALVTSFALVAAACQAPAPTASAPPDQATGPQTNTIAHAQGRQARRP